MKAWRYLSLCLLTLLLGTGCSKQVAGDTQRSAAPAVTGVTNADSSLAYEHTIGVELPQSELSKRMISVRFACFSKEYGECEMLEFSELTLGKRLEGTLRLRAEPEAIEPLIAMAGSGGEQTSRQTRAEDLALAVADNRRQHDQLRSQLAQIAEFQVRDDLAVSDMLALARESSQIEALLQANEREAAQQSRRLQTNLLTLNFRSPWQKPSNASRLSTAFSGSLDSLVEGVEETIGAVAFGLPFLLVAFPLALLWRWFWRWSIGAKRRQQQ